MEDTTNYFVKVLRDIKRQIYTEKVWKLIKKVHLSYASYIFSQTAVLVGNIIY